MKKETIADFRKEAWVNLCVALNALDANNPPYLEHGICGNLVKIVHGTEYEDDADKPYVNMMMGVLFERMGVPIPLADNPDFEPWEGPNKELRVKMRERLIAEVGAVLQDLHAAKQPAADKVPELA